ncbi:MAG: hypothetical protein Q9203_003645 [Teloschistes exilis]
MDIASEEMDITREEMRTGNTIPASDPPARVLRSQKRAKTVKSYPDTLSSQVQTIKLSTLKARLVVCKDKLLQIEADLANIGSGELKLSIDK